MNLRLWHRYRVLGFYPTVGEIPVAWCFTQRSARKLCATLTDTTGEVVQYFFVDGKNSTSQKLPSPT